MQHRALNMGVAKSQLYGKYFRKLYKLPIYFDIKHLKKKKTE